MTPIPWLVEARRHLGLRELPGAPTEPTIARWLKELKAWWSEDATPWCGTFAAHCIKAQGLALPTHWYRAKDWLNWGEVLTDPAEGCIVVFNREGGGHVGFVIGRDLRGRLLVIGGNQGDAVSVAPFEFSRVAGYRWPTGATVPPRPGANLLPIWDTARIESSRNEA